MSTLIFRVQVSLQDTQMVNLNGYILIQTEN